MGYRFGPGRVRRKLAEMLARKLAADGLTVRVDPESLWPAEGFWRSDWRADCWVWEGQIEILDPPPWLPGSGTTGGWKKVSIGSYDRMSDCIRGFTYQQERFALEVFAEQTRSPTERFRALRKS